jgi:hypothetical protein
MKRILCLCALLTLTACDNPSDADRALRSAGYEPIKTGGYAFFACGKDDTLATKFTAKNPRGDVVTGVVCSGLMFKNSTIRF